MGNEGETKTRAILKVRQNEEQRSGLSSRDFFQSSADSFWLWVRGGQTPLVPVHSFSMNMMVAAQGVCAGP